MKIDRESPINRKGQKKCQTNWEKDQSDQAIGQQMIKKGLIQSKKVSIIGFGLFILFFQKKIQIG